MFDPDVPSGYSGEVTVNIDLYSAYRTLITIVSDIYFIYGENADYFGLDLGTVSTTGFYYLLGEILFGSISTDTIATSTFYLSVTETTINGKSPPTDERALPYKHKTGYKRGQDIKSAPSTGGTPGFTLVLTGLCCLTTIIWRQWKRNNTN